MTPDPARDAALDIYVQSYDRMLTKKVHLMEQGKTTEAAGADQFARWIERAIDAELRDPVPPTMKKR